MKDKKNNKKREKKCDFEATENQRDEESEIDKKNTIIPQISYYFCARAINTGKKEKHQSVGANGEGTKKIERSPCKTGNSDV